MPKIMSDNDVLGQFQRLTTLCQSSEWMRLWSDAAVEIVTFVEVGLNQDASDSEVWQVCQEYEIILVTGNRTAKQPESLEEVIRSQSDDHSLPVITLGDSDRILNDSNYARQAVERLFEILIDLENVRGVGRLFIP